MEHTFSKAELQNDEHENASNEQHGQILKNGTKINEAQEKFQQLIFLQNKGTLGRLGNPSL